MRELRANTQVIVIIGPFPDVGDGFTPQTDIDISATNEAELLKHGSTTVVDISGATWAAIANCRGHYGLTLTTSHTDTEGMLRVVIQDDSDCLPVTSDFMVLSEAEYDSKYVAKDSGYKDVHVKTVEAGIIANASFNADVGSTAYATNIIALAVRKVLDELNLDHLMKIAVSDRDTIPEVVDDTVLANLMTKTDGDTSDFDHATDSLEAIRDKQTDIETDTGELQTDWTDGGRLDLILDIIAADTTTDIPAKLLKYIQLLARSDAAIETDNATELTAINADGGSGAGNFSAQTDSGEAIRDHVGDGTNLPEAGGTGDQLTDLGGMSAGMKAEVNAEVDNAMDTAIASDPTARSANDFLIRAGTVASSNMTADETTGAYSFKKVDDEATEETFGGTKAASGTITSGAGVTTRDPA